MAGLGVLRVFARRPPPALHKPDDPTHYGGQHHDLNDRRVLIHHHPVGAEHPPEDDEDTVPQSATKDSVEHEPPEDRHTPDPGGHRDQGANGRDEVPYQDSRTAVPLELSHRLVQIFDEHEPVPLEAQDDLAQTSLTDPD